jgi:hypothetical protein
MADIKSLDAFLACRGSERLALLAGLLTTNVAFRSRLGKRLKKTSISCDIPRADPPGDLRLPSSIAGALSC